MNQFFYTFTATKNDGSGEKTTFTGSFDLTQVLHTFQVNENSFAVVLNNGHEESTPVGTDKHGTIQKKREWVETTVYLNSEDYAKYCKLYNHELTTVLETLKEGV